MSFYVEKVRIYHEKDDPSFETRRVETEIGDFASYGEAETHFLKTKIKNGKTFDEEVHLWEKDQFDDLVNLLYVRDIGKGEDDE